MWNKKNNNFKSIVAFDFNVFEPIDGLIQKANEVIFKSIFSFC